MNILQVNASARTAGSVSTRLAGEFVATLRERTSDTHLVVRDLARTPHPVLDEATLQALFTPAEQRTPEQAARVALDDVLIAEIQAADVIVLGVPMYNFGVPAGLKNWIDAIARVRVTFRYTEQGPEGLLKGKQVYLVLARGGRHRDTPLDTQLPYLKSVLGFLGMSEVEPIFAEGLSMGPEAERAALDAARARITELIGDPVAA